MTSVANISGIQGSTQVQQPAIPHASASAAASSAKLTQAPLTGGNQTVVSPTVVFDPQAGLIVKYLNGAGKVIEQTPSAAAVAYLHAGLTAEGLNKVLPGESAHKASAVA